MGLAGPVFALCSAAASSTNGAAAVAALAATRSSVLAAADAPSSRTALISATAIRPAVQSAFATHTTTSAHAAPALAAAVGTGPATVAELHRARRRRARAADPPETALPEGVGTSEELRISEWTVPRASGAPQTRRRFASVVVAVPLPARVSARPRAVARFARLAAGVSCAQRPRRRCRSSAGPWSRHRGQRGCRKYWAPTLR